MFTTVAIFSSINFTNEEALHDTMNIILEDGCRVRLHGGHKADEQVERYCEERGIIIDYYPYSEDSGAEKIEKSNSLMLKGADFAILAWDCVESATGNAYSQVCGLNIPNMLIKNNTIIVDRSDSKIFEIQDEEETTIAGYNENYLVPNAAEIKRSAIDIVRFIKQSNNEEFSDEDLYSEAIKNIRDGNFSHEDGTEFTEEEIEFIINIEI